jgi:hypothetical protein
VEYTAEADQTTFPYPFRIFDATDLAVYQNASLLSTSQYAVTGVGDDAGGTVVLVAAAEAGDELIIESQIPATQDVTYTPGGAFPAASHERGLDRLARLIQQNQHRLGRCLQLNTALSFGLTGLELPHPDTLTLVAGGKKYLSWNDAETNLTLREIAPADDAVGLLASSLTTSTLAGLPAAGTAGRLRLLTDSLRGLYHDTGARWVRSAGDWLNARDAGCAGDGVTDDTAALTAALALGVRVYLPPGTYLVSDTLVAVSNTQLVGDGIDRSIIKWASGPGSKAILNDGGQVISRVLLQDLTFDGNRAANGDGGQAGVQFGRLSDSTLARLRITGMDGHSLQLSGVDDTTNCHDNTVAFCQVDDYGSSDGGGGGIFLFRGANNNDVIGCTVHNEGAPAAQGGGGISQDDWSTTGISAACHHNRIVANLVHDCLRGITGSGLNYSTIVGNTIRDCQAQGVWIEQGTPGDNARSDTQAQSNSVVGNTIEACATGITDDGADTTVAGNTIASCTTNGLVKSLRDTQGSSWTGNSIYNSGSYGMRLNRGKGMTISGNTIDTAGVYGVYVIASNGDIDGVSFSNNTIANVQQHGLVYEESGANVISLTVRSNHFRQVSLASSGVSNVIHGATGSVAGIDVSDNVYTGTQAYAAFTSISATASYVTRNRTAGQGPGLVTLADSASVSCRNGDIFVTGGTTTITSIAGARVGKTVQIRAAASITVTDNASTVLAGNANFDMTADDTLTLTCFVDGVWTEVARSVN